MCAHHGFYARTQDVDFQLMSSVQLQPIEKETGWSAGVLTVLSFCVHQVSIFSRSEVAPGEFECWGHFAKPWGLKAYVTWMTVAVFVLPALIITICQVILVVLLPLCTQLFTVARHAQNNIIQ